VPALKRFVRFAVAMVAGSLLFAAAASANSITVDSTADTTGDGSICTLRDAIKSANYNSLVPPPTFGNCASGSVPSPDTIDFSLGAGPHTIQLASVLPAIANLTTITGPGAGLLTVRGELGTEDYPVIPISDEGTAPFPSVTLEGMKITNGSRGVEASGGTQALTLNNVTVSGNSLSASGPSAFASGAGVFNDSTANVSINGSTISGNTVTATTTDAGPCCGIFNLARGAAIDLSQGGGVSIVGSTISNNTAHANGNQTAQAGAAIATEVFNPVNVTITRSTISGNTATATVSEAGGDGGAFADGGGIQVRGAQQPGLSLDRVTITGNTAAAVTGSASGFGHAYGGGVVLTQTIGGFQTGEATGSTIAGNTVSETGPGSSDLQGANVDINNLFDAPGQEFIFQNTIIASGTGATNCAAQGDPRFGSLGYNLETSVGSGSTDTDECFPTAMVGDQAEVSPANLNLGGLQDNGGTQGNGDPVGTMAPGIGSYAVDAGFAVGATEDQRGTGFARTFNMNPGPPPTGGDNTDIGAFEQQLTASPTSKDFGSLKWGATSSTEAITLTNLTGNNLTLGALTLGGTDPGEFQLTGSTCATVANKATCGVNAAFHPVALSNGARSASLLYSTFSPMALVELSGTATDYLSLSPGSQDFGSTQVGTPTGSTVFTVTNTDTPVGTSGTLAATLTGANASEFGVTADTCTGVTLARGTTCTVSVRMSPSSAGAKAASLNIAGTPGGTISSTLTGTATSPSPPPPPPAATTPGPTGQQAAALKKCKKKKSAQARKKCKKKAKSLPV
jgi:CSLREA domain-containing protein